MDYEIERCIPKRVIFNFNNVTFMDSAGIGLLLGRYKLTKMLRRRSRDDKCKKINKKNIRNEWNSKDYSYLWNNRDKIIN